LRSKDGKIGSIINRSDRSTYLEEKSVLTSGATAPHGTYFITGNHEYYSGAEEWCTHVASLAVRVLRNECVSITAGSANESFDLAGVDDWASHHLPGGGSDLPKTLVGRDPNKALVLLAHQPALRSAA
jgi:predicted MPP superfamily phosphohydrolase